MDRADAIRLLRALAAAGNEYPRAKGKRVDSEESLGNWIGSLEIGLEGSHFVGALAYAGNEGWLADAARRDWTSLTRAGQAIARR